MKMGAKTGTHMVDLLFTLALFCVFAASALMVVLIGAAVYKNTVERMDETYSSGTSITYVSTKIRQNDVAGGVRVEELNGIPTLVLESEVDGETYQTRIYHYEGFLRETFSPAGLQLSPGDGQRIVEVEDFWLESSGGVVYLTAVEAGGKKSSQLVVLRSALAA